MTPSVDVVILGGGPAGMACAWELAKERIPALVVDRNDRAGGLARTLEYELPGAGTFFTDIGPHRFYSKNLYLYAMMEDILGPDWIRVERFTRFFIDGRFFHYPPQILDVIRSAGPLRLSRMAFDYARTRARGIFPRRPIANFEDYAVRTFGRALAELNMLNYTEKIWGVPCRTISPDWATQRISGLSVREVLKKAFRRGAGSGAQTLTSTFFYPRGGAGVPYERMREGIEDLASSTVRLGARVVRLKHTGEAVHAAVIEDAGGVRETIPCLDCVSSIPITDLVAILDPPPPPEVLEAARSLRYRSQVYIFLMLDRDRVGPDNWVYFPDASLPFGRISEPKSFSEAMAPEGKTSLFVEHFCFEGDRVWSADPRRLAMEDIAILDRLKFIRREEVLGWRVHREKDSYPLYDIGYRERLAIVRDYLARLRNLQCVGRAGRFRYNNQDHSLETGILAARSIIEDRPFDLESVGAEGEYFESGYVPAPKREEALAGAEA